MANVVIPTPAFDSLIQMVANVPMRWQLGACFCAADAGGNAFTDSGGIASNGDAAVTLAPSADGLQATLDIQKAVAAPAGLDLTVRAQPLADGPPVFIVLQLLDYVPAPPPPFNPPPQI